MPDNGATPRLPDFLVLGPPKTATTTLHHWLVPHPRVFVPDGKDFHFFDIRWDDGIDSYAAAFAGAAPDQVAGEVSATYFGHPHAPDRIASSLPSVRCMAVLRDPAERAWSHYWMQQAKWAVSEPFEMMMTRQMEDPRWSIRGHGRYLDEGRYGTHVARWERLIGRDRLLMLLTDDIRDEPTRVYDELCRFIGVAAGEVPAAVGGRFNATRPVRSPWVRRTMMRVHIGKWLPAGVVTRLDNMNRTDAPPKMPADIRARLVEWYAPEMAALEKWLGRPLPTSWSAV